MIQSIVFDFGNVLCTFDNWKFIRRISDFTDKTTEELYRLIYIESNLPKKYESGYIDSDEFIDGVIDLCGLNIEKEEFMRAYTEIFTPIRETFDLVKKLSPRYKLGLLSNTSDLDFQRGIKSIEIFNLFDKISLSYKVKAMKPSKEIFIDMLEKLNLDANECVYVDDVREYVDAATALGMIGIHFTSPKDLLRSLEAIGVK